jgi:hypothetical protein
MYKYILSLVTDIINGPTNENLPTFKWSATNFKTAHYGQPDEWNFPWITVKA